MPHLSKKLKIGIPALIIVVVAIVLLVVASWIGNNAPETSDAHVYADTIKVVPQVSGQIVKLPVHDNEAVKKGQLLFQIDPRPYKLALEQAQAELKALEAQIKLTQRSVNAQKFGANSADAAVAAARAKAAQAAETLKRVQRPITDSEPDFAGEQSLSQILTWTETKTVWHPKGL